MLARGGLRGRFVVSGTLEGTEMGWGRCACLSLCAGSAQADAMKSGSSGRKPFCFRL